MTLIVWAMCGVTSMIGLHKLIFCCLHVLVHYVSRLYAQLVGYIWLQNYSTEVIVYWTRQLPMGAGHCPWGGYTDRIVCNIHGEGRLESTCCAMLRPAAFSKFGTLPATLATCQHWETFLDEAPCRSTTFGKLPKLVGTLPKGPHLTLSGHEWTKT